MNIEKTLSNVEDQLKLWTKLDELVCNVVGRETTLDGRKHLDELRAKLEVTRSKLEAANAGGARRVA